MSRRHLLHLAAAGSVAVAVAACGGDGARPAPPGDPVLRFTIVAENMAWSLDTVTVRAGTEVKATVENRDRGVPHNLHIRAAGDPKTPLETGPVTQTMRFTIDRPGTYEFLCDAHPMMTGEIIVV